MYFEACALHSIQVQTSLATAAVAVVVVVRKLNFYICVTSQFAIVFKANPIMVCGRGLSNKAFVLFLALSLLVFTRLRPRPGAP
jgi:hypothetical protein